MYHTEPPTDKTIREWYMNSSRVAACALRNEQAVRAHGPGQPVPIDMLLSAVPVLVVAQLSSEIPEGLMNNPLYMLMKDMRLSCCMYSNTIFRHYWKNSNRRGLLNRTMCYKGKLENMIIYNSVMKLTFTLLK